VEQDSSHEFLLASGKAVVHPPGGEYMPWYWVSLEHGTNEYGNVESMHADLNLRFQGPDTLLLTSGPGVVIDGGGSQYHRDVRFSRRSVKRLPLRDRPRRLPETGLEHFLADSLPYLTPPKVIKEIQASYPDSARLKGVAAIVTMRVVVNERGEVDTILAFEGPRMLLESAMAFRKIVGCSFARP